MTTTLITGANRGVGLALTQAFAARGDDVIAVCRQPSEALTATGVRVEAGIELTDDACLAELSHRLKDDKLDVLLHNAGVLHRDMIGGLDVPRIEQQWQVNALAPLKLTSQLLGHLRDGAKVVFVTSRMGSIADNTSGGRYGYRMSKAALNMAGVSLAHDLKPRGIAVGLVHPGYVRTDMTGGNGLVDADEAAAGILARTEALSAETTGGFWHAISGEPLPW